MARERTRAPEALATPSLCETLRRGGSDYEYWTALGRAVDSLHEHQRNALVEGALQFLALSFWEHLGLAGEPNDANDAPLVRADPRAPVTDPIYVLRRLSRAAGGRALQGQWLRRYIRDTLYEREYLWGLHEQMPPALARFLQATGPASTTTQIWDDDYLTFVMLAALTAVLELEGYTPRRATLVALPQANDDQRWCQRLDEMVRHFFRTYAPEAGAAIEAGHPIDRQHTARLVEQIARRASPEERRWLILRLVQLALQLAVERLGPVVSAARQLAPHLYPSLTSYLHNLRFTTDWLDLVVRNRRARGNPIAANETERQAMAAAFATPWDDPGARPGVHPNYYWYRLAREPLETVIRLPRLRENLQPTASQLVADLAQLVAYGLYNAELVPPGITAQEDATNAFVQEWWTRVRERLPFQAGEGSVTASGHPTTPAPRRLLHGAPAPHRRNHT